MRFGCRGVSGKLVLISVLITSGALGINNAAVAEGPGTTPLDNTNWENNSCHFKLLEFFTVPSAIAVSLISEGDDLGLNSETYSVSGNSVTISPAGYDKKGDKDTDSFTGTFSATSLTGTHVWTDDEGGSHNENCTYVRAKF